LVSMLQTEARSRQRQSVGVLTVSATLILGIVVMLPQLATDYATFKAKLAVCFVLLFGVGGVMVAEMMRRSYRGKKSLTDHIARVSAKTQIGALVRALKVDSKSVKNIAKTCLTEYLPQLNAGDAELLGEQERDILIRTLAISPNDKGYRDLTELWSSAADRRETAFRVAILKAYEQVGGAKELPLVTRLAEQQQDVPWIARSSRGGYSFGRMPAEITQAAAECLPYLQLRANEELASRQLLRASGPERAPDPTLLRSAASVAVQPSDQLLRPAESQ